jgi:hypothetical protein
MFQRSLLLSSSFMKMEAADSSEMLVTVDQASQFYIPDDSNV